MTSLSLGSRPYFSVIRDLIHLAIPLCFVQLSFQLMSLVDTAMAGRLNGIALAGVGLGSSCFFSVSIFVKIANQLI